MPWREGGLDDEGPLSIKALGCREIVHGLRRLPNVGGGEERARVKFARCDLGG